MKKDYICDLDGTKWGGIDVPSVCPNCGAEGELQAPALEEVFTYKVVLEKKDPLDTIIERSGIKAHLTIREVRDALASNLKLKKECEGQITLDKAKIENVQRNHPAIKDLKPVEVAAVLIYADSVESITKCERKLEEIEEANTLLERTEKEIAEQVGIAIPLEALKPEEPKAPVEL
ncbi:MAG: hypothetical protein WC767_02280 [Candidatus Paceibacterota bacterium]|jgi:hypothetical protein